MNYITVTLKVAMDDNFSNTSKEYQAVIINEMVRQGQLTMFNKGLKLDVSDINKSDISYDYNIKA
ncbi:hypothetical protein AAHH67_15905 [Niallia circulans]